MYKCKKCGKDVFVNFGSGIYCSRSCANSRQFSAEINSKRSKTVKEQANIKVSERNQLYALNPSRCIICNKVLPYSRRHKLCCSEECKKLRFRQSALNRKLGGPNNFSSYGKKGIYKGIKCDSTYELAFVIYCLDHNIKIERNQRSFKYQFEGNYYNYYPDFYLEDTDEYIEIKGRDIGPVKEKANAMYALNLNYKLLHFEDLKFVFDYVFEKYNCKISSNHSNLQSLYDK